MFVSLKNSSNKCGGVVLPGSIGSIGAFKIPKEYYSSWLSVWLVPVFVFLVLFGLNYYTYTKNEVLNRSLIEARMREKTEHLFSRLEAICNKRAQDLTSLAGMIRSLQPEDRMWTLRNLGGKIMASDGGLASLNYINQNYEIEYCLPESLSKDLVDTNVAKFPETKALLDFACEKGRPVSSKVSKYLTEKIEHVMIMPLDMNIDQSKCSWITGVFRIDILFDSFREILSNSEISFTIRQNTKVVYSSVGQINNLISDKYLRSSYSKSRKLYGQTWEFSASPKLGGTLYNIPKQSKYRFLTNVVLSAIISLLLALAFFSILRLQLGRARVTWSEKCYRILQKEHEVLLNAIPDHILLHSRDLKIGCMTD